MSQIVYREEGLTITHSPGTPPRPAIGLLFHVGPRAEAVAGLDLDAIERLADELDDYLQRNGRRRR